MARRHTVVWVMVLIVMMGYIASCRDDTAASNAPIPKSESDVPYSNNTTTLPVPSPKLKPYTLVQQLEWRGPKAFRNWGESTDGFFALPVSSAEDKAADREWFDSWSWSGSTLIRNPNIELPRGLDVTPLSEKKFAFTPYPGDDYSPWPLVLSSFDSSKDYIKKWDVLKDWTIANIGGSPNGKFAAIYMTGPPDFRDTRIKIGLLNVTTQELRWVYEYRGKDINGVVGHITVSDDGKAIAVMGWNHGIARVDTETGEMRTWFVPPPRDVINMQHGLFSPDSLTLYAADSGAGCVFVLDAKTGEVISQWFATTAGKSIYGQRVSCFTVSPDGAWLAAGTGPAGEVFLFDARTPENAPILLPHGHGTTLIVSFSPDSKYVASVAGGLIKIWAVASVAE